jgi:RNA polymerase sigma-70 factor (ECF subfamily)
LNPNEGILVQRARRGDPGAFTALVETYRERITRLAINLLGSREDAEDVAQETFVRVYSTLPRFDTSRPFAPWLYRIATNLCLDHLRRRKARPQTAQLPEEMDVTASSSLAVPSPENTAIRAETHAEVMRAVQGLPENYRVVVVLRYLDDLPYSEIAEILGISEANVQMRLSRARQRLRAALHNIQGERSE